MCVSSPFARGCERCGGPGSRRRPLDGDVATADEEDSRNFATARTARAVGARGSASARGERRRGVEDGVASGKGGRELVGRGGAERRGARRATVRTSGWA